MTRICRLKGKDVNKLISNGTKILSSNSTTTTTIDNNEKQIITVYTDFSFLALADFLHPVQPDR